MEENAASQVPEQRGQSPAPYGQDAKGREVFRWTSRFLSLPPRLDSRLSALLRPIPDPQPLP